VFQAFTATVEVKDDGFPVPLTASTTITIMVVNINDPPEFRDDVDKFSHFSVNENSDVYNTWGTSLQVGGWYF
jgi:hypothetical protein